MSEFLTYAKRAVVVGVLATPLGMTACSANQPPAHTSNERVDTGLINSYVSVDGGTALFGFVGNHYQDYPLDPGDPNRPFTHFTGLVRVMCGEIDGMPSMSFDAMVVYGSSHDIEEQVVRFAPDAVEPCTVTLRDVGLQSAQDYLNAAIKGQNPAERYPVDSVPDASRELLDAVALGTYPPGT